MTEETGLVKRQTMDVMAMSDSMYARLDQQAEMMANGSVVTVPKHLQGSKGDCMAIIIQAYAWGMQPLQVAQATHLINGKLGYEAKLVNAVLCNSGAIQGRPHYEYKGDWSKVEGKDGPSWGNAEEGLSCVVTCTMNDGTEESWECLLSSCKVRNSPNWKCGKVKLQIAYQAIKEWSRVHAPDAILGVYTEDELPMANLTEVSPLPTGPSKTNKLADMLADGDESDNEVVEPKVEVIEPKTPPKKKKAEAPPKKELVLDAEKAPEEPPKAPEGINKADLDEAIKSTCVPLEIVKEYLIYCKYITEDQMITSIPEKVKERIVANPDSFKDAISDYLDKE